MFVHLHMATRFNPAHTSVSKRNAKLNIVISPLFNRLLERQPDLFAVVGMPSGNEVFKCDLSGNTEAQLGTARGRPPRRHTVIVASTEKISSKSRLKLLIRPQGFGTPTGTEIISPAHEKWWMSVIARKLMLTGKMKLRISTSVRRL